MLGRKRTWFGLVFMAVMFYFLLRNIEWDKLLKAFTQFHLPWLLPALLIYLAGYIIRGYRWVILLSPVKKCSFQSLFPILIIGFMANNLLPARAGEFVRAYLNGTKEGISRSASFATIVLERLFDGLTMMILLWAALFFGNLPVRRENMPSGIQSAIHVSPYVFGSAFVFLFVLLMSKPFAVSFIGFFTSHAPLKFREPLEKIAKTFFDGLEILKSAKESLLVLIFSIAAWTCEFISYFILAIGMGIGPFPLSFWSAALLMAIVNLGILIPNAPGGFGLFEFIGVALLIPFGVPKELALGYMLVVHFMVWIPINLMGLYYSAKENLSLGKLENR